MNFQIQFKNEYSADGTYTLRAPGCILASLYWANEYGPLADYTAFGILPLAASNGTGSFLFTGGRAIPREATAVCVRAVSGDLKITTEELFVLPLRSPWPEEKVLLRAAVMSDLHLVRKSGTVRRALGAAAGADCLLLTGDLTNDGTEAEFALLEACLQEAVPGMRVFCVNGNHDLLRGAEAYFTFEKVRKQSSENLGCPWYHDCSGIDTARLGEVEIIALDAVKPWKELSPVSKAQLQWLDDHLAASTAAWHIILCHTPVSTMVPGNRSYMSRDEHLKTVLEGKRNVIFLAGHTHLSPNLDAGNVLWDRGNAYIGCGSIRPTELGREGSLAPKEWVDGCWTELTLTEHTLTIRMYALHENKQIARGCYRFEKERENYEED